MLHRGKVYVCEEKGELIFVSPVHEVPGKQMFGGHILTRLKMATTTTEGMAPDTIAEFWPEPEYRIPYWGNFRTPDEQTYIRLFKAMGKIEANIWTIALIVLAREVSDETRKYIRACFDKAFAN